MSPAKASTSNDNMVTATVSDLGKPLPQTENNKKDEAPKKAVDFSVIFDELGKSKLCDDKIKLEVRPDLKGLGDR